MKIKFDFNSLLENNHFLMVLSVLIAVLGWFVVVYEVDGDGKQTIHDVPVLLSVEDSVPGKLGLSPIMLGDYTVDVVIRGDRGVIGNVEPDDIKVTANLSSVSSPGTYELHLNGTDYLMKGFTVEEIRPDTASIRFDHMVTKKFPVAVELSGLSIPDGYVMDQEYASPEEVTITGPATEMGQISRCVVQVSFTQPLNETATYEKEIVLLDEEGNEIKSPYLELSDETVTVTVPVLKKKTVPITFDFVNVPAGMDTETLQYEIIPSEIDVAGPADMVDHYTELHLGYVDVRELTPDMTLYYETELPPGFISVENIQDVSIEFNPEGYTSKKMTASDIRLINVPDDYNVTVSTKRIANVEIYGPEDEITALADKEVIAEIDMTDAQIRVGQVTVPVNICIPTKSGCWAYGDYTAVITVLEK